MTRLKNTLRTRQGRNVSGRGLPTVTSCLSRFARPGLSCKGCIMASSHNPSRAPKEMMERQN